MKKIIFFISILVSVSASAQLTPTYLGGPNSLITARGPLRSDSSLGNPLRDTTFRPYSVGIQVFRVADNSLYLSISTTADQKWVKLGTGSAVSFVDILGSPNDNAALNAALNAKQNTLTLGTSAQIRMGDHSLQTFSSAVTSITDVLYSPLGHSHAGLVPIGGATGYILKKNSATDYDYSWQPEGSGAFVTQAQLDDSTLDLRSDIALKLNITDTTNKWLTNVFKINDSVFTVKGGTATFAYKDSTGTDGNNFPSSLSFTDNTLTLGRTGLSNLTASFDTSRWHTKLYYDGIYASTSNLSNYLLKSDSTIYYPYASNPKGYLQTVSMFSGNTRLTGLDVVHVSGLTHYVTPGTFYMQSTNTVYSFSGGTVTLPTADPTDPRWDAIVVNTSNAATSVTGDPDPDPAIPTVDPLTELYLTAVNIGAGATTPSNIGQTIIRDEANPLEWVVSKTMTTNDAYATNPYHLTISQRITAANNNQYLQWTSPTPQSKLSYNNLVFFIRNNSAYGATRSLQIQLFNGSTQVGVGINIATYGYSRTLTGSYQAIAIPLSAFTGGDAFNAVRLLNTGTGGTVDVQIDYVQLQSGITVTPGPGYTDAQARVAVGSILSSEFTFTPGSPGSISINTVDASKITGNKTSAFITDFDSRVSSIVADSLLSIRSKYDSAYFQLGTSADSLHAWWQRFNGNEDSIHTVVSGGIGTGGRLGIEDNLGIQDRAVNMQGKSLILDTLNSITFNSYKANGQLTQIFADSSSIFLDIYGEGSSYAFIDILDPPEGKQVVIDVHGNDGNGQGMFFYTDYAALIATGGRPPKLVLPLITTVDVSSPTKIAVWHNDTLKSADVSVLGSGGSVGTLQEVATLGNTANLPIQSTHPNGFQVTVDGVHQALLLATTDGTDYGGSLTLKHLGATNYSVFLRPTTLTGNRNISLPDADGTLALTSDIPSGYTLPIASAGTLGGIRVGSGLSIDGSGILSATGGGYTNLTEFVGQNNWKVFYSDGSGDVQELALGAANTFLKSNGATSAPTFGAPFTLTTTGSSGAATFNGTTLNIPNYGSGASTWNGLISTTNAQATGYTMAGEQQAIFTGSSPQTFTLPVYTTNRAYFVKNRGTATLTVASNEGTNNIHATSGAVSSVTIPIGEGRIFLSGQSGWNVYGEPGTGGAGATDFATLTDVNLTSLATNDFLKWDGTDWINRTPAQVLSDIGAQASGSYQAQLSGTGYVKFSGTTPSYISSIPNADLANSSITIAGNSTALGGSVTQDNITGLSSTGIIKRTGANTLAIAVAGTDYLTPTGSGASLTGITAAQVGAQASNSNLTTIAGLTATTNNFMVGVSSAWASVTPSAARTALGATTIGSNLFTLPNPSAITFPRFNADNTVSALTASAFRTAIGAGTGDGNVTKVGTPANTEVGVWTGDGTLGRTTGLTFSGAEFSIPGSTLRSTLIFDNISSVGSVQNSAGFVFGTHAKPSTTLNNKMVKISAFNSNEASWVLARYDRGISFHTGLAGAAGTTWDETDNERMRIAANGRVSIGVATPTSRLHIAAGTATANTAPIKLISGTALTTPEDGAIEYHSSHLYFTIGSTRYQLDQQGGGSGDALTSNPLSQFAATTSAQLRGVLTDEDGTGNILTTNGSAANLTNFPTFNQNTTGSAGSVSGTNVITNTNLRQSAGLSVIGRSANTTGNVADIVAANDNEVLRRSGTTIGFGTLPNASLTNSSVTVNGTSIALGASGTVTAAAGTLTGTTLNSSVVTSSLTSVGTLTSLTMGGTLAMESNNITGTGSLGATGSRFTKLWATDIESTNMPTVGGVSLSTTFQGIDADLTALAASTGTKDNTTYYSGDGTFHTAILSKGIGVVSPTASENLTVFYTPHAITITGVQRVVQGSSPSVTYVLNYGTNRASATGTIVASNAATTTGSATLNTTSIPAGSYVWVTTSAVSGTIDEFSLTILFKQ